MQGDEVTQPMGRLRRHTNIPAGLEQRQAGAASSAADDEDSEDQVRRQMLHGDAHTALEECKDRRDPHMHTAHLADLTAPLQLARPDKQHGKRSTRCAS